MSDIFICYSRTDSTVASQLVERLRAEGWSVFRDVQTHVGKRWHKEIEKELHAAKAVVVLWWHGHAIAIMCWKKPSTAN